MNEQEKQKMALQIDTLINNYYIISGRQSSSFEEFKNLCLNVMSELLAENQSLAAHLKTLQDEKLKDNVNIEHDLKEK